MQSNKKIAQAALASVVALTAIANAKQALAETPSKDYVKCYGVAAAGKNDCGTVVAACSGTIKVDRACYAWIYTPKGICKKLAGSSIDKPAADCKNPDGKPATK